jgi:hypothetical protein
MKAFGALIVVVIIALSVWVLITVGQEMVSLYQAADSDLKLGFMTASGSVIAFIINNAVQSSRERRARLFEAKRQAYGEFLDRFTSFFHRTALGQKVPEQDMIEAIQGLTRDIMTWGSAPTVNAFNLYQRVSVVPADDQNELFSRTEQFLRALGLSGFPCVAGHNG